MMDMKRVEEIEQKLETILNFDTNSSTKLSQSSMTHEEHHSLLLELLEEDVLSLIQTIKQQQEQIEHMETYLKYIKNRHDGEWFSDKITHELSKKALENSP